jgi:hypothetical protein
MNNKTLGDFKLNGFTIVSILPLITKINSFKKEIYNVFNLISINSGLNYICDDADVIEF